eukprot:scaffold184587_cov66-Cyclotella_meneghiniana.AAC.1
MNALLWAVLTNRTFLYQYHDFSTCLEYEEGEGMCISRYEAHPYDCHNILHITPWVASYDVWKERLQLDPIVRAQIHTMGQGQVEDHNTKPYDDPTLSQVIQTGWQFKPNPSNILLAKGGVSPHLSLQTNQQRLVELKSQGVYFFYGMLFEALFSLDQQLLPDRVTESTAEIVSLLLKSSTQQYTMKRTVTHKPLRIEPKVFLFAVNMALTVELDTGKTWQWQVKHVMD